MKEIEKTYYVTMRVADMDGSYVPSVDRNCKDCGCPVAVSAKMVHLADQAAGIVCLPCVMEQRNKSKNEIIKENIESTINVLVEDIEEKL